MSRQLCSPHSGHLPRRSAAPTSWDATSEYPQAEHVPRRRARARRQAPIQRRTAHRNMVAAPTDGIPSIRELAVSGSHSGRHGIPLAGGSSASHDQLLSRAPPKRPSVQWLSRTGLVKLHAPSPKSSTVHSMTHSCSRMPQTHRHRSGHPYVRVSHTRRPTCPVRAAAAMTLSGSRSGGDEGSRQIIGSRCSAGMRFQRIGSPRWPGHASSPLPRCIRLQRQKAPKSALPFPADGGAGVSAVTDA